MKSAIPWVLLLFPTTTSAAHAQWVKLSSTHPASPQLLGGSVSVSVSPATVDLTLVPGGRSPASPAITITAALSISVLAKLSLYAFFASTSALTDSAGDVIPSSAVLGQCANGAPTSFTPFIQSGPFASGTSLLIYQTSSLATLPATLSRSCNLLVDLTNLPQLPAGSYAGTVVIQAQVL